MSVVQLFTIGTLVWLSGALFSAGWQEVRRSQPLRSEIGQWGGPAFLRNVGGAVIWGAIGIAAFWALLVVMGEIGKSEIWSLTRATIWAH